MAEASGDQRFHVDKKVHLLFRATGLLRQPSERPAPESRRRTALRVSGCARGRRLSAAPPRSWASRQPVFCESPAPGHNDLSCPGSKASAGWTPSSMTRRASSRPGRRRAIVAQQPAARAVGCLHEDAAGRRCHILLSRAQRPAGESCSSQGRRPLRCVDGGTRAAIE